MDLIHSFIEMKTNVSIVQQQQRLKVLFYNNFVKNYSQN